MKKFLLSIIFLTIHSTIYSQCVTNTNVTNLNSNGATLNWTSTSSDFDIKFRRLSCNATTWNHTSWTCIHFEQNSPGNSLILDTLAPNTTYEWRVRPNPASGCSYFNGNNFTTSAPPSVNQTVSAFTNNPVNGYMQYSFSTLEITNPTSSNLNIRPEFVVSLANGVIQQGNFTIEWDSPIGGWINIPYNINTNGEAEGYWSFPAGDSTGTNLLAGATQQVTIRVSFMNPNNNPPNGASAGVYTANWCTYEVDTLGNIIQSLASCDSVSLTLSDCSNFSIGTIDVVPASCNGGNDGSAMILGINNGSGNYSYLWSNGQTSENATGLSGGTTYSVIVTDLTTACIDSTSITVPNTSNLSASLIGTHVTCNAGTDGTLTASASGGSGNYDIIWTSHPSLSNSFNQTGLSAGNYLADIIDLVCGEIVSVNFTIIQPSPLNATLTSANNTSCNTSLCNGIFGVTVSGETGPYSYSWSNGYTDSIRLDLCAGTYTITATDANNCNSIANTVTIYDSAFIPNVCISSTDITCNGNNDGTANAFIVSGNCGNTSTQTYCASSPGDYQYSNIELVRLIGDSDSISNSTPFTCDTYEDYTTQFTTLTPGQSYSIDVILGTCNAGFYQVDTGAVYIDWNADGDFTDAGEFIGGLGSSNVQSSSTLETITFTVPNNALSGATRMRVVSNAQINNSFYPDTVLTPCNVGVYDLTNFIFEQPWYGATEDYSIVINSPLSGTYLWSNGSTNSSISGLSSGWYSCTVTDASNCSATDSVFITEPQPLSITESITHVSCNGLADGSVGLTITGGTNPYVEDWGVNNPNALSAGTYTYIVTDGSGCSISNTVTISQPSSISITTSKTDVSCNGGSDGTASVSPTGGTPPYSYLWSNGQTTSTASGLTANTYTCTIADSSGCTETATIIINEPAVLSSNAAITHVTCNGGNDGVVVLYIAGGTTDYTLNAFGYTLTLFAGQDSISSSTLGVPVPAGTYPYSVTDANGCQLFDTIYVTEPSPISITQSITHVSCNGGNDGTASLTISGGTTPYTRDWGSLDSNALSAGIYTINITDGAGCITSETIIINEPNALVISDSTTHILCNGDNTGSINIDVTGGTIPYSYLWNNGSTSEDLTALFAGTYTVTVTDSANCTETLPVTVNESSPLSIFDSTAHVTCNGENNGSVNLSFFGATPPYIEDWGGVNTDSLSAGVYPYTITDGVGCVTNDTITILEPLAITIITTANDVTDCSNPDGSIDIDVNGGTSPYSYTWTGPNGYTSSFEDIANLNAGTYTINILDSNACVFTSSIFIQNPNPISMAINSSNYNGFNISCHGNNDGWINVNATGGVGTLQFYWDSINSTNSSTPLSTSNSINNLSAGTYHLTITDNASCAIDTFITITEPNEINVIRSTTQLTCNTNGSLFAVSLIITGGTTPYDTVWANNSNPDSLIEGTHYYAITDANNCILSDSIELIPSQPFFISGNEIDVACHGDSTGAASFIITGGTYPFSYLWSNGDTNVIATGLPAGIYTCLITDANNCTAFDSVLVSEPYFPLVSHGFNLIRNIDCFGDSTGIAVINVSGGMPFDPDPTMTGDEYYHYQWSNGETDSLASNLIVGNNICIVTDRNNCVITDSITITQNPEIVYTDSISNWYNSNYQIRCYGENNGDITISTSGGVANTQGDPYGFTWTGPNGFTASESSIDSLITGTYHFTIEDSLGCTADGSVFLAEPDSLYLSLDDTAQVECYLPNIASGYAKISIYGGVGYTNGDTTFTGYNISSTLVSASIADSIFEFLNHPAGTHVYDVFDNNYCTITDSFTLRHLTDSLYFTTTLSNYNGVNISCKGYSDGWISIDTVIGGLPGYHFNWSNGDTSYLIDTLSANWYTGILVDSFNCVFTDYIQIREPDFELDTEIDTINPACNGYCDGALIANTIDGTPPYLFEWFDANNTLINTNDSVTISSINNLCTGSYQLKVTDVNGCLNNIVTYLEEPLPLSIHVDSVVDASENGWSDGGIYINVVGGNGGYIYHWAGSNGYTNSTQNADSIPAGMYELVVSDILGCTTDTMMFIINQPPPISINIDSINTNLSTSCYDTCDAQISINPVLSPPENYTVLWASSNGFTSTDQHIDSLCPGDYTLFIIPDISDTIVFNFTVTEPDSLDIVIFTDGIQCNGLNAVATAYTYGGTLPYSFLWSNGTPNITSLLDAGYHSVTVVDNNGCTLTDDVTISNANVMSLVTSIDSITCFNGSDATINVDAITNGTPPYIFSNDNFINTQTSSSFSGLGAGWHTINVKDSTGCIVATNVYISNHDEFIVTTVNDIFEADTVSCNGDCDGTVLFNYQGNNGSSISITEQWSGVNANGDLCPGIYDCIFTDSLGCTTTLNDITVINAEPISINDTNFESPTCPGGDDGIAFVNATDGTTNPMAYEWPGILDGGVPHTSNWPNGTPSTAGLEITAGIYWCIITNSNGCVDSIAVDVEENTDTFLIQILHTDDTLHLGQVIGNTASPYSYLWSTTETTEEIVPASSGQYWLALTDTNGCISDTAYYNIMPTDISENISEAIMIYPNPTSGNIFIESKDDIDKIIVSNHLGKRILIQEGGKQKRYNINLSNLSKGVYYIGITINNQIINQKIILQ